MNQAVQWNGRGILNTAQVDIPQKHGCDVDYICLFDPLGMKKLITIVYDYTYDSYSQKIGLNRGNAPMDYEKIVYSWEEEATNKTCTDCEKIP